MELPMKNTPCYVLDKGVFVERLKKVKGEIRAFGGKLCYAIKANPFLIPFAMEIADKFEVCSPGELEICRLYGVPGEKILFSGVVKAKEDIMKALAYPVDVITLESLHHWELLKTCLKEEEREEASMWGKTDETEATDRTATVREGLDRSGEKKPGTKKIIKIMPRLTNGGQFGMEEEEIVKVLEEQKKIENISFCGIHYFTGTQKKGNKYEKEIVRAGEFLQKLIAEYGTGDEILEYGPGFAVPYFVGDDFENPYKLISEMKQHLIEKNYPFRIDIELGRYLAASCGSYYTKIMDIKKADGRNYCLVDGGIHHVNYYGSTMAMRTPFAAHLKGTGKLPESEDAEAFLQSETIVEEEKEYMICGALCTFSDILIRGIQLKNPQIGDMLIFENIGAYSITESGYLFLSRNLPAIYCKNEDGSYELLRDKRAAYLLNYIEE